MSFSRRVGHTFLASFLLFAFSTQACSTDSGDDDSEESNVETAVAAALAGRVSSAQEGPMEGVLVTAKKEGSTIAVTVVTDREGRYEFPVNRLGAGRHRVTVRAIGYELARPIAIDVNRGGRTNLDLSLAKVNDVSGQMTNGEWLESFPGLAPFKSAAMRCFVCHTLERVVRSTYDAEQFKDVVFKQNAYALNSKDVKPVPHPSPPNTPTDPAFASWLASINLSSGRWNYELKTMPRPQGKATRVIVTEYDLPRAAILPHDVVVDRSGTPWFNNWTENGFGKLNPKTGEVTELSFPLIKEGAPTGSLSIRLGDDNALWLGSFFQGGIVRFDLATGAVRTFKLPPELDNTKSQINMTAPGHTTVDGKIWIQNAGLVGVHRLDLASGAWETWKPFEGVPGNHNLYDVISDSKNNAYFLDLNSNYYGRIDARTGEVKLFQTPAPNTGGRRGSMDDEDRLWFGEYSGNAIAMFDTKTEVLKEWPAPRWAHPYDVALDKKGNAWTGSMVTDRVQRLDPRTGEFTEYLLPRSTNIRRVFVDKNDGTGAMWVGSNHGASVVKIEPLD